MKSIYLLFNNLKAKLILSFALILVIPSISIGSLAYFNAKDAVENEMVEGFGESINLLNSSIDNTIQPKIHAVESLSKEVTAELYDGNDSPELRQQFKQYAQLHQEVQSIYVGTETGLFVQEPRVAMDDEYDPRKRDWYIDAMANKGETIISDPYISAGTDDMVVTISKATEDASGVMAVNIYISHLQEITNQVQIGEKGYALLLDANRKYIAHPTVASGVYSEEPFYDELYSMDTGSFDYVYQGEGKILNFVTNKLTGWKIIGAVVVSEIDVAASPILKNTMTIIIIALIIGAVGVFFVIKSIVTPIHELKEKAQTVSNGLLTEKITIQSNDDIGQLGKAFNDMQESLRQMVEQVDQNAEQVAASAEELTASAEETTAATEQVATAIQEVANGAEKQTNGVDQNALSIEEIRKGVGQIAESSARVSELSYHTTKQAEIGGKTVSDTVNQMNSIHKSVAESNEMIKSLYERSKEVNSILSVISGIAEQTNLLSLNAAIEAARAGEQGKGFAVVAGAVKKLAEQSQASAKEIYEIINGIQNDTASSVEIMGRVTEDVQAGVEVSNEAIAKFEQILKSTKEITPQMEEISAAAQQMSSAVQEVTATANELTSIAKENATTSEEVAASTEEQLASMEEISASAQSLSSMAEDLKALTKKFKY